MTGKDFFQCRYKDKAEAQKQWLCENSQKHVTERVALGLSERKPL